MGKKNDVIGRHELDENLIKKEKDLEEKGKNLDDIECDLQTIRKTIANMDFSGTSEGTVDVKTNVEGAEKTAKDTFDREDEGLDQVQEETEITEKDIQERQDSVESDLGKLTDASAEIKTQCAEKELLSAKDAALQDIDFMVDKIHRIQESRKESERMQNERKSRVQGSGGR